MTLRYEGVRFSDGSCAVRRVAADPCDRATLTFESIRELEDDVGSAEVSWIADRGAGSTKPLNRSCAVFGCSCPLHPRSVPRSRPPAPAETYTRFGQEQARRLGGWQLHDLETGQELRAAYEGGELRGHFEIVELQPGEQPVPPPSVAVRVTTIAGDPPRPVAVEPGHYEPTEEIDEP